MNKQHFDGAGGMGSAGKPGAPTQSTPQSRTEKRRVLRRMGKYLFAHPVYVILAFVLMISSNALALAAPKLSGAAIDLIEKGAGKIDLRRVLFYVALLFIFYTVSALLSYVLSVLMVRLGQRIIYTEV